ncbi:MAG: hypothetical protein IPO04_12515 [Cytophagaceae bacterium]|nr:hypothetical protein [Cytophagaceae bacterium]
MKLKSLFFVIIGLFFSENIAFSQNYYGIKNEEFGKSRVQTKRFEWKTIKSNNFEFNFYRGGEELAKKAARKAEEEHGRITDILGYTPFSVMKIYIYTSPEDKRQSNIGLVSSMELDGKVLNLSKARIQIAYQKNDSLFQKELIKEISTLFVYDMLYGGSLKEAVQSQLLLMVPDWYIKGIAAYIAENNNNHKFSEFRNRIDVLQNQKLSSLKDADAELVGQSIWNYIALKYGKENISNILNLTRIIRNEQSSITSTLGVSFNKFLREWKSFYVNPVVNEKTIEAQIKPTESSNEAIVTNESVEKLNPGEIDTENYVFDLKNIEKYKSERKFTDNQSTAVVLNKDSGLEKSTDRIKLSQVKAYKNYFVSNGSTYDILIDPIRRFGIGSRLIFNDLLENNILTFSGYLRPSTPLFKNFDYTINYGNYTKKLDFIFEYKKRSINIESIDESNIYLFRALKMFLTEENPYLLRRLISQNFSTAGVYPINQNLKASIAVNLLKTTDIEYDIFDLSKNRSNLNQYYLNPKFDLVYDKTKLSDSKGFELGTKGILSYEKVKNIGDNRFNFNKLNIDIRHYQPIVKGLVGAGRINYGRSSGNSPKFTFIGGAENWINRSIYFAETLIPGKEGDMRDILFYNFAGNLRGFDFARLYGHNHLLTNLELRAYMSEYFPRSSMSSSLLRSLQLVLFTDIGTAWNGSAGPFSKQNSLNTILLGDDKSPFFAEVTNFKNPFLAGFGAGIRTTILGVLVKVDYAIGREDKEYNSPKFYISVGKDF